MKFAILFIFIFLPNYWALAASNCTKAGAITYSLPSHRLLACPVTGVPWEEISGTAQAATCTGAEEGKQKYASNMMQYCDGTNWRYMDTCPVTTSECTTPGVQKFTNTFQMIFCDGSHWVIFAGACTSSICSPYGTMGACNANPVCTWVGTCIDGI